MRALVTLVAAIGVGLAALALEAAGEDDPRDGLSILSPLARWPKDGRGLVPGLCVELDTSGFQEAVHQRWVVADVASGSFTIEYSGTDTRGFTELLVVDASGNVTSAAAGMEPGKTKPIAIARRLAPRGPSPETGPDRVETSEESIAVAGKTYKASKRVRYDRGSWFSTTWIALEGRLEGRLLRRETSYGATVSVDRVQTVERDLGGEKVSAELVSYVPGGWIVTLPAVSVPFAGDEHGTDLERRRDDEWTVRVKRGVAPTLARPRSDPRTVDAEAVANLPSGAVLRLGRPKAGSQVRAVAFSPDGGTIAVGTGDRMIRLWDSTLGRPGLAILRRDLFSEHALVGMCFLRFVPDGKTLVSAFPDRICSWDPSTGALEKNLKNQGTFYILRMALSLDGTRAATVDEHDLFFWDLRTGAAAGVRPPEHMPICAAFSADGKTLATGQSRGPRGVILWDVATRTETRRLALPGANAVAFSPDGKTLAFAGNDGRVGLVELEGESGPRLHEGHADRVNALAFSPDGRTLASASGDWRAKDTSVRLWDTKTGRSLGVLEGHQDLVHALAFSPDGRTLASGSGDSTVLLWRVPSDR